jgi:hypothetical protein
VFSISCLCSSYNPWDFYFCDIQEIHVLVV